jgi:glycosyltransferase involved in cell wall biosynthesis
VVAPIVNLAPDAIDLPYLSKKLDFIEVPQFNFIGVRNIILSITIIPGILVKIFNAIRHADHIHLRCPGNMGLLGALIQIFFPLKTKTAKYAGNWDWNCKQPWTYRLQQWILRNTFLTRKMQVLVYGSWPDINRNIKPFFTASYSDKDKLAFNKSSVNYGIELLFVGSLTSNKRPFIALEVLHSLLNAGLKVNLKYCGDGPEITRIQNYIEDNHLHDFVTMTGNVSREVVIKAYQKAHFLIFPSVSEGWPKVVAEAMWWGCIPITTSVSCVPQMIGNGLRGVICEPDSKVIITIILNLINHKERLVEMSNLAKEWSRNYTLERFESDIAKLL